MVSSHEVDVLLPAYNAGDTLRESVESILAQTLKGLRVIIIDDGSRDETARISRQLARADSRVVVLDKENGGIVSALNLGLEHCSAALIARQDADDVSFPSRFERQAAFLKDHPHCVGVGGWAEHIDAAGVPLGTFARPEPPAQSDPAWLPVREPYLIHPFLMVRTQAIKAVGGYRDFTHAEDADLYWRLQELGELVNLPEYLGYYRLHTSSVMSKSIANGRLAALHSELAGLSARRRRSGLKELSLPELRLSGKEEFSSVELLDRQSGLTCRELEFLRVAYSAKLMDLCEFRPYELSSADCRFVRDSLSRPRDDISQLNASELDARLVRSSLRLMRQGRLVDAMRLTWPKLSWRVLMSLISKVVGKARSRAVR